MNILYFHQHFSTPSGSTGIRSYEMAKHLIRKGHQVTMVCGSYGGGNTGLSDPFVAGKRSGVVEGIKVVELDLGYSNSDGYLKRVWVFLSFALRSIYIALTFKYDLVFATSTPLTAGIPGIFARWFRGKRFVFEVRDLWPELPKAMGVIRNPLLLFLLSCLEWAAYRSAHRIIGLAPGMVEGIVGRGVKADRVAMIPNGCDLDIFDSYAPAWRPTGISQEKFIALFAGTHGIANDLNSVLNAAAELKNRGRTDIHLILIGQGKLKPKLQQRAAAESLDNVTFLDPVNKAQLAGLMATADIGLQVLANIPAFYRGTSPNKFFDYIASGLPVLNNYPGWLADMILANDCGYVATPESASSFADALEKAKDDEASLLKKSVNCKALAKAQFDRVVLAEKFVSWLEGAMK